MLPRTSKQTFTKNFQGKLYQISGVLIPGRKQTYLEPAEPPEFEILTIHELLKTGGGRELSTVDRLELDYSHHDELVEEFLENFY